MFVLSCRAEDVELGDWTYVDQSSRTSKGRWTSTRRATRGDDHPPAIVAVGGPASARKRRRPPSPTVGTAGQIGSRSATGQPGSRTTASAMAIARSSEKNAVMLLHELKPELRYQLVAISGPCHSPTFTVETEVNGQVCGRAQRARVLDPWQNKLD